MPNINIFTDFTDELDFEDRIKLIKQAGFDGVMMFFDDKESFTENLKTVKRQGLNIENVHCPFGMLNGLWTDENAFEIIKMVQSAIDVCHFFAIPVLVIHPTDGLEPPPVSKTGITYFTGLVRYAGRLGVKLAFENIQRPEYLEDIFSQIDEPNVKFCYDIGHENCFSKGSDCMALYGSRLEAVHLHDNDGDADTHLIPFDGNIDYESFVKKLASTVARSSVSLEIMKHKSGLYDDISAEEYIQKAYAAGKRLAKLYESCGVKECILKCCPGCGA